MHISCNWLSTYVEHGFDAGQLADLLTHQAVPVESSVAAGEDDTVLELEVTSNRPDLLSHLGVAQEVAAATRGVVELPATPLEPVTGRVEDAAKLEVQAPDLCPLYTARVIRNVRVGPSPAWLQSRLQAVGLRPVNNVVDITNFVLFECGQPLHAFDLERLDGKQIVVRRAHESERITLIDGSDKVLTTDELVIADGSRPVALAGVMGGADTEIRESTTCVLLESAWFDPAATRRTSKRLKLSSDSSYRFERGANPVMVEWASARAAALLCELAGGELLSGVLRLSSDANPRFPVARELMLRKARLWLLAGVDVDWEEAVAILRGLGFDVLEDSGGEARVRVPAARFEVAREIDLIEEVLRVWGYDRVPVRDTVPIRATQTDCRYDLVERLRCRLAACGYREMHSVSFVPDNDLWDPPLFSTASALRVKNPVRADTPVLRRSLYAGLAAAKAHNLAQGNSVVQLFEASTIYTMAGGQPSEPQHLGVIADADFFAVKGVVEHAVASIGVCGLRCRPVVGDLPAFDVLERAEWVLNGQPIGFIGRVGASMAKQLGGASSIIVLLDLEPVLAVACGDRCYVAAPSYPAVVRDLAALVAHDCAYADLDTAIEDCGLELLRKIELVSVFDGDGKSVAEGRKSVALRLCFQSEARTLTGTEVDASMDQLKERLTKDLGASFREA